MKKTVYKTAGLLIFTALCVIVCKTYLVPLVYQPAVYSISDTELRNLNQAITSSPVWQQFLHWFPGSALPFSMPAYYHEGISKPLFLVERNLIVPAPYAMSLWLYAYVETTKHNIKFTDCRLQVDYLQGRQLVASYTLSGQETQRAFRAENKDAFIAHLMQNVYPQ